MIPFAILLIPVLLSLDVHEYVRWGLWAVIGVMTILDTCSTFRYPVWLVYMHTGKQEYAHQWEMGRKVADIVQDGETIFIPHARLSYVYYTGNLYPSCMAEIGYGCGPMELTIEKAAKWVANTDYVLHFTRKDVNDKFYGRDFEYFYNDSIQQYVDQFPSDTLEKNIVIHYLNRPKLVRQTE